MNLYFWWIKLYCTVRPLREPGKSSRSAQFSTYVHYITTLKGNSTFFVVQIHKNYGNKYIWIFKRRTFHSSSSNTDSYGDYLFAISMDIYHEFSEFPLLIFIVCFSFSDIRLGPKSAVVRTSNDSTSGRSFSPALHQQIRSFERSCFHTFGYRMPSRRFRISLSR